MLLGKIQPSIKSIDLIAVTVGPGLEPCLWTGIEFAKDLYKSVGRQASGVKLIGVNHLEGHLYSFLLNPKSCIPNPASLISRHRPYRFRRPYDFAFNEKNLTDWKNSAKPAMTPPARLLIKSPGFLNLPYPGGPNLEKLANHGNSTSINFPRPMIYQKNYDFSFSGLKTAVLYYLKDNLKLKIFLKARPVGSERGVVRAKETGRASESQRASTLGEVERRLEEKSF